MKTTTKTRAGKIIIETECPGVRDVDALIAASRCWPNLSKRASVELPGGRRVVRMTFNAAAHVCAAEWAALAARA